MQNDNTELTRQDVSDVAHDVLQEGLNAYAREKIHAYACALIACGFCSTDRAIFDEACRMFTIIDTMYTEKIEVK